MITDSRKRIIKISAAVNEKDIEHMKLYILGAVHGFTAAAGSKSFTVRDIFGNGNRNWNGTPIKVLPHKDATERAAQDLGKLLRKVLAEDKYEYEEESGNRECTYRRV